MEYNVVICYLVIGLLIMHIKSLKTHDEIAQSFDAFLELRPHLRSKEIFVTQVMEQYKEGYGPVWFYRCSGSFEQDGSGCPAVYCNISCWR